MEELCKIRDIQRAVCRFEQGFEDRFGICLNEGMALCSLRKAGRLASGELGELLGLTASNTSKVICSVETKGYVERVVCREDRRKMYFTLTAQGAALLNLVEKGEVSLPDPLERVILQ